MKLDIHGITLDFPFEPYQLQRDYMTKVIEALESKQNAVLESPTGEFLDEFLKFHNHVQFHLKIS